MMIKISKYTILAFGFSILLSACKKESVGEEVEFATLNIDNKSTYALEKLKLSLNGQAFNITTNGFNNIKVPAGTGKLSITDSTGKSLIDTSFNFPAGKTVNWIWFQPSNDVDPVILENKGSDEPQPDPDYIKVKMAHFAPNAFPRPFDVIFYWFDSNFELVEGGRMDNIGHDFQDKFTEVLFKDRTGNGLVVMVVDHETQQPLLDDLYLSFYVPQNERILTLYIFSGEYGTTVTGTPYKVSSDVLFLN